MARTGNRLGIEIKVVPSGSLDGSTILVGRILYVERRATAALTLRVARAALRLHALSLK